MGKGSAPSTPDPYKEAQAQTQYGEQTALFNTGLGRTNSINPYGSQTWSSVYDPSTGARTYTQNTNLTPTQQAIFNQNQQNQQAQGQIAHTSLAQAQSALGNPLHLQNQVQNPGVQLGPHTNNVPGIIGADDLNGFANKQQNAAYQNQMTYLQPQYDQQKEQLDSQLRNSGAHPGDPAYDNAMKLLNNNQQQGTQEAFNNSYQTGLQAQQALYGESANTNQQLMGQDLAKQAAYNQAAGQQFGQNLQAAGFQNQNLLQARDQALNEYGQLSGQGGGGNAPQFGGGGGSGGSMQAPDIMGALNNQYQGQLAKYNAGVSQSNSELSAAAMLAASYFGA